MIAIVRAALVALLLAGCALDRAGIAVELDAGAIDARVLEDGAPPPPIDARLPDGRVPDPPDAPIVPPEPDAGPCTGDDPDDDGVRDPCDVCPAGDDALDDDGDRVPDACDRCPSGDDAADADADGIADACDDWPCGALDAPHDEVSGEGITISSVSIDGGGNRAVVRAGASVSLALQYRIDDTSCGGCIDQVEIGIVPGDRLDCVYDANPPGGGAGGDASGSFDAPTEPGLYELRHNLGQNWSCYDRGASTWWAGAPPPEHTFGLLCVVP